MKKLAYLLVLGLGLFCFNLKVNALGTIDDVVTEINSGGTSTLLENTTFTAALTASAFTLTVVDNDGITILNYTYENSTLTFSKPVTSLAPISEKEEFYVDIPLIAYGSLNDWDTKYIDIAYLDPELHTAIFGESDKLTLLDDGIFMSYPEDGNYVFAFELGDKLNTTINNRHQKYTSYMATHPTTPTTPTTPATTDTTKDTDTKDTDKDATVKNPKTGVKENLLVFGVIVVVGCSLLVRVNNKNKLFKI